MNVFDFAMEKEEESRKFYEKLAAAARTNELKTIFNLLAESEREHHEHLAALKAGTDSRRAESVVLERARDELGKIVGEAVPETILAEDQDGYGHAIKAEEESIRLYEELAEKEQNVSAAGILKRIAEEEKHHLEVMENIYEFVESPRTYLAWGEFGNLKEY
ncbi:ferritin family protein [Geobacter sp. AOG1]|uniref:ferritin-like domain-containing protein n=1 Tax=Geobacter sp. AOG1 TaxID=1566346 RepID=UPI001CC613D9|nr:ferritin family protein [Geobacter sp. AOG1]GFE57628.1 ferritin [Geobacter sp. AOG1]